MLLQLILLLLLHYHLVLVELLDGFAVDVLEKVRGLILRPTVGRSSDRGWLLFDPQIFWRLEIIPENTDDLLNLGVRVLVNKKVRV